MSSQTNFWDDPEVKAAVVRSAYAKFENVGDRVVGTVSTVGRHIWADGSLGIQIHFSGDDAPTVTASQVLLKQALFEVRPQAGDVLSIELIGVDRSDGKTLKKWRVERTRGDDVAVVDNL